MFGYLAYRLIKQVLDAVQAWRAEQQAGFRSLNNSINFLGEQIAMTQAQLDAKVAELNEKLDGVQIVIVSEAGEIQAVVGDLKEQIRILREPQNIDVSGLEAATARLDNVSANISGLITPEVPAEEVPTEEVPAEEAPAEEGTTTEGESSEGGNGIEEPWEQPPFEHHDPPAGN
jgi:hypothetical protein